MSGFTITNKKSETFEVLVDDADLERVLLAGPWSVRKGRHTHYVLKYVRGSGRANKRVEHLHRFLTNAQRGLQVDHINGNGLDNRQDNLRLATQTQNLGNARLPSHNTSGFKGVSWDKDRGQFFAKITFEKKQIALGRFRTAEEAASAYWDAATKLFGVFARKS